MANQKKTITEPRREIPVRAEVDVLVVGGGPAGIMAARAAAGKGLRVMLIESRGYLGGNLTIGLPILGYLGRKGNQIIKGLPQLFIDRLRARGAAGEHRPCKLHVSLTIIDPEEAKTVALEMLQEVGVEVLMYVFCVDVVKNGDAVEGVVVESKAGREAILAKTVIDCTGDGDVACRAGVECRKGDADGGMQPPTLMFCMKGVDVQKLRDARVTQIVQTNTQRGHDASKEKVALSQRQLHRLLLRAAGRHLQRRPDHRRRLHRRHQRSGRRADPLQPELQQGASEQRG